MLPPQEPIQLPLPRSTPRLQAGVGKAAGVPTRPQHQQQVPLHQRRAATTALLPRLRMVVRPKLPQQRAPDTPMMTTIDRLAWLDFEGKGAAGLRNGVRENCIIEQIMYR